MMIKFPHECGAVWTVTARLGIDLPAAIREGDFEPAELSQLMSNCAECWHTRKCGRWCTESRGAMQDSVPQFCASREAFAALKARRTRTEISA